MDHRSSASPSENAGTDRPAEIEAQRERLRNDLIAAAEEEAAAVMEKARRDIAVTVRRARRDLLVLSAQLRMCGLEPPEAATKALNASDLETWASRDALEESSSTHDVRTTQPTLPAGRMDIPGAEPAPRRPVEAQATPSRARVTPEVNAPVDLGVSRSAPRARGVVAAAVAVLVIAGGIAGWRYFGASSDSTSAAALGGDAPVDRSTASVPTGTPESAPPAPERPAPVVLQTIRPVWMRVGIDGESDAGRLYAAGETKEFTPRDVLTIRAGDAGAVLLSVNGGSPVPLGPAGQVVTRRITANQPVLAPDAHLADGPVENGVPPSAEPRPSIAGGTTPAPVVLPPAAQQTAPSSAASTPAPSAPAPRTDQRAEILAGHSQWLDAYTRGDQRALGALTIDGFSMRDDRSNAGSASSALNAGQLSDIRIDFAGTGAVLTARVRTPTGGAGGDALLSEVWVRRDQGWGLMGVRITPVENLPKSIP